MGGHGALCPYAAPLWAGHRWLCPVPPEMRTVHSSGESFLHLPGPILRRRKERKKEDKEGSSCYEGQALIFLLEQSARPAPALLRVLENKAGRNARRLPAFRTRWQPYHQPPEPSNSVPSW